MLSENLELRGQILHLEKELERNTAQRIADHALETKTKLEAQLADLMATLSSLGVEPPRKRFSPSSRNTGASKTTVNRSPTQRRLRNLAKEAEASANQHGRLPKIDEHKTYAHATSRYVVSQYDHLAFPVSNHRAAALESSHHRLRYPTLRIHQISAPLQYRDMFRSLRDRSSLRANLLSSRLGNLRLIDPVPLQRNMPPASSLMCPKACLKPETLRLL
jgi:hypothetical protein